MEVGAGGLDADVVAGADKFAGGVGFSVIVCAAFGGEAIDVLSYDFTVGVPYLLFVCALECPICFLDFTCFGFFDCYASKYHRCHIFVGDVDVRGVGGEGRCRFGHCSLPRFGIDASECVEFTAVKCRCIEVEGQHYRGGDASGDVTAIQYLLVCARGNRDRFGALAVDEKVEMYRAVLVFDVCAFAADFGGHVIDGGVVVEVVLECAIVAAYYCTVIIIIFYDCSTNNEVVAERPISAVEAYYTATIQRVGC